MIVKYNTLIGGQVYSTKPPLDIGYVGDETTVYPENYSTPDNQPPLPNNDGVDPYKLVLGIAIVGLIGIIGYFAVSRLRESREDKERT